MGRGQRWHRRVSWNKAQGHGARIQAHGGLYLAQYHYYFYLLLQSLCCRCWFLCKAIEVSRTPQDTRQQQINPTHNLTTEQSNTAPRRRCNAVEPHLLGYSLYHPELGSRKDVVIETSQRKPALTKSPPERPTPPRPELPENRQH